MWAHQKEVTPTQMKKLTDKTVKSAKPKDKTTKLWDGEGLYLEVTPAGSKRWRFKYVFGGKEKLLSFGIYPYVTLKEARERRYEARKLLANHINPSDARKAKAQADEQSSTNTFELVAREWIAKQKSVWSERHTDTTVNRLEYNVFKYIGPTPIDKLTPTDILRMLRRIEGRGVLETAHRVLTVMGQIFRYGVATGRIASDPSRDLRGALPPVNKGHLAAVTDPNKVGGLLKMLYGYDGSDVVNSALRLAPLVFVRPGELRHAEWADIDLKAAEWRFDVTKTGQKHIVPLSTQAVAILKSIHPTTGSGRYVFPAPTSKDRPMSNNAILAALRRMAIPSDEMCGHGFRAMARTLLDEVLKFPPHLIEHQLAHIVKDPLGRAYNRTTHIEERRVMMQTWADYLDKLRLKTDKDSD
jgi:integrase